MLIVFLVLSCCEAQAQPTMDKGVQLYNAGRYEEAAVLFKDCVGKAPKNPNALYYYGLCLHQLRNISGATAAYKQLIATFPTSLAAGQAQQALQIISKGAVLRSAERDAPDYDSLPQDAVVYFQKSESNAQLVEAYVNNRQIMMVFDTGAETCAFGKNHLIQLGIRPPEGPSVGNAIGVGSQSTVPFWRMTVDLKVGTILRRNMEILVQENLLTPPLLGQTFFRDFRYTVDSGASSIRFTKKPRLSTISANTSHTVKSYATAASDPNSVPFVREGDTIRVMAEVNGRPCKMIFDTGASRTVFTFDQLKRLGINVPEDAEEEVHRGVGGEAKGAGFEITRLRLGPIEKRDFRISAVREIGEVNDPLLGQTFLGNWQYTIDYTNKVIRFVRR